MRIVAAMVSRWEQRQQQQRRQIRDRTQSGLLHPSGGHNNEYNRSSSRHWHNNRHSSRMVAVGW